jgi:hypothetical protein
MLRVKSSRNKSQDVKALRRFIVSSALPLGLSKYNLYLYNIYGTTVLEPPPPTTIQQNPSEFQPLLHLKILF